MKSKISILIKRLALSAVSHILTLFNPKPYKSSIFLTPFQLEWDENCQNPEIILSGGRKWECNQT